MWWISRRTVWRCEVVRVQSVICAALVLLSAIVVVTPASADSHTPDETFVEVPEHDELNGTFGTNDTVGYDRETRMVSVTARNNNGDVRESGFVVNVDGRPLAARDVELAPGETEHFQINITDGLDAVARDHSVVVSTYGDYVEYNFTRQFDPDVTEEIPVPRITNVEIKNGSVRGEPSTVAMVGVENPSVQTYGIKLMVFTEGTDGSLYPSSVPPKSNRTIKVELLDPRGSVVAGEARLYAGNLSKGDGGIDQVEFVGQADSETRHWEEEYVPVKGTWRKQNYVYDNETVVTAEDREERVLPGGLTPERVGFAAGALLLVLLFVVRRRRR
jgi:hypothetical protein